MKIKRFIAFAVLGIMIFSGAAFSAQPEDALSSRADDSVYFVLRLEDTASLLKWIFSSKNINAFMPLILASEESNEILGAIEIISAIVENTPLRSIAVIAGVNKSDTKTPFFQMALTLDSGSTSTVRKIADGRADAKDIAKLLLGENSPLAAFAETMIKVERSGDNIFRVDNALFLKAQENLIILGLSGDDIKASLNALKDSKSGLFADIPRKFNKKDFAFMHVDYDTAMKLNGDKVKSSVAIIGDKTKSVTKYFDKPLNIEIAFEKLAEKFLISMGFNLHETLKKEYADKYLAGKEKPVKGGYIDFENPSGKQTPLFALGGILDISKIKNNDELKPAWNSILRNVRNRLGINEQDLLNMFNGAFSFIVNDNVTFEGFKIPALYISQKGTEGTAKKLYDILSKSNHFTKVQDGILQIDSSLSPISCLISRNGETLNIDFADLASLSGKTAVNSGLNDLMNRQSISSLWIDFAGIQSWLVSDENGVFTTLAPLAALMGYSKEVKAVRDVLEAKLSVPSMSFWADSYETCNIEFAIKDVKPEEGLFSRLINAYMELKPKK